MANENTAEDERATELSTNTYIFPELVIDADSCFSATIDLPVNPTKPLAVAFVSRAQVARAPDLPTPPRSTLASNDESRETELAADALNIHRLSHLPPLALRLALPDGYPATEAPIVHLESQSSWVPEYKLQELEASSRAIWEDIGRDQVVFTFIDHLQQAAEDGFSLSKGEDYPLRLPAEREIALLDYDLKAKRAKFEQETFDCGICLEPKKGSACHRLLLCSHVFCVACLQDFYNTCITEGDISSVKCLAPDCGKDATRKNADIAQPAKRRRKADRTLDPSELLQIPLDQETVQRYMKLKRKNMLESDQTTIYCPRQWCQGAARSKKYPKAGAGTSGELSDSGDEDDEAGASDKNPNQDTLPPSTEKLAICEDCSFAFCSVCKASWHGEFAVCFPRKQHELTAEEKASEEYLKKHSTACPTCDARCQKTFGCNHMICFRCKNHFCYLCSAWLTPDNPYKHFNTLWTPCYMRLWELEEGDGDNVDRQAYQNALLQEEAEDHGNRDVDVQPVHPGDEIPPPIVGVPPVQVQAPAPPPIEIIFERPAEVRINNRAQQGLVRREAGVPRQARHRPGQALQRFLRLVERDEEDEWDSDELEGSEDGDNDADRWVIPIR
ncbi:translation termination inhibitor protein itt1 [Xylographa carneopallida]|nr:translation termination inhibitor protein itt1 [Xylographa carneopallida]